MLLSVIRPSTEYGSEVWKCNTYKDGREEFMIKLRSTLGEAFKDFEALDNIERASFVLGC